MKELIDYILQFGNLNKQQTDLILGKATELELRKDEYLIEAGKVPKQTGFLVEGVLRVCYYNNKGEEITRHFIDENNFAINWNCFQTGVAATEYVQAVTDCRLFVFSKLAWEELFGTIVGWDGIVHNIIQRNLAKKLQRRGPMVELDATARYLFFLENFPNLINRLPLSHVASYLGMTQSSLSRIRKKIR